MAGRAKFDKESAFKSIIGASRDPEAESTEQQLAAKRMNKDHVQRSYFLDWDIDKALRRMALEEEKNLTETVNDILRKGLEEYLE